MGKGKNIISKSSKLGLKDFLIMPIQRLPRYLLLLRELSEVEGEEGRERVKRGMKELNVAADHMENLQEVIF